MDEIRWGMWGRPGNRLWLWKRIRSGCVLEIHHIALCAIRHDDATDIKRAGWSSRLHGALLPGVVGDERIQLEAFLSVYLVERGKAAATRLHSC